MNPMAEKKQTYLIISQTYVPDTPSVGQHMHDAAAEMVRRGWRVITYTSARAYDDPSTRFPRREEKDGVDIRRLPLSSFGKRRIAVRLLGGLIFVIQVALRGLFTRHLGGILVSTSPPFAPLAALFIRFFRRAPVTYWAMDINPDQAVAMGQVSPRSTSVKLFNWLNRHTLAQADAVVALDRFMADRLDRKTPVRDKCAVMPPWPHEQTLEPLDHADNPFRAEQELQDRFVIMYSGNISPSHPVDTVLEAAARLERDMPELLFLFIGGGLGKQRIESFIAERDLTNVRTLPYQPFDRIKYSLSAADVHLVAMGNDMVGIVHPCKIYGAMAVSRPVLLLGPRASHAGEIIAEHDVGWQVDHGDIDRTVTTLKQIIATDPDRMAALRENARRAVADHFGLDHLRGRFCDVLENIAAGRPVPPRPAAANPGA